MTRQKTENPRKEVRALLLAAVLSIFPLALIACLSVNSRVQVYDRGRIDEKCIVSDTNAGIWGDFQLYAKETVDCEVQDRHYDPEETPDSDVDVRSGE